jgi:hypothetical protein
MDGERPVMPGHAGHDAWGDAPPAGATMTVLLVDDSRSQSARIQDRLVEYGISVVWRPSYRVASELLRHPDAGQLVDLVLIDQAFESTPEADLLTRSEVDALPEAEDWDVRLHQGLFIMTRLNQDMRDGRIPATPMMILTQYATVDIAAQVCLGGYDSKRRLLSDPYTSLKSYLPPLLPTEEDVDRRLGRLVADGGLDEELAGQVRGEVVHGRVDLEEACKAWLELANPDDWAAVGRMLERLAGRRTAFSLERLATALGTAWLASGEGWLRIAGIETLGPLGGGLEAFRVEIAGVGTPFGALVAARPVPAGADDEVQGR